MRFLWVVCVSFPNSGLYVETGEINVFQNFRGGMPHIVSAKCSVIFAALFLGPISTAAAYLPGGLLLLEFDRDLF
jgi:hypothetical protein